ncbi:glutaredoxin domain-containing protein [Streptomyces mesophilus]|uniref:glutaredoxin domain-containing protein n=1 Tax=Streptomyces mesophilus TaxID=1775132 RepID=UPI00332E0D09
MTDDEGVTVYWRPGCPYCMRLRVSLRLKKLPRTEINIWEHPDAAAFVRSVADGNETVPTVVVAGHAMVNPSPAKVMSEVRSRAPHLLT